MTYIETDRLILRDWNSEDLDLFISMNKDERVMRYFPAMITEAESESFMKRNIIIGCTGAGKSTFARKLATKTGYRFITLI